MCVCVLWVCVCVLWACVFRSLCTICLPSLSFVLIDKTPKQASEALLENAQELFELAPRLLSSLSIRCQELHSALGSHVSGPAALLDASRRVKLEISSIPCVCNAFCLFVLVCVCVRVLVYMCV